MEQQIQQLTQEVNGLKIRTFDAEEQLKAERAQTNAFLQQLVNVLKVRSDENGNVTLDSILERSAKLVEMEEGSTEEVEVEEVTE